MTEQRAATADKRIVVGVDGSPESKAALRWAGAYAVSIGAALDVVVAWQVPMAFGYGYIPPAFNVSQDFEKALTEAVDEVFAGDRPPKTRLIVREGLPASVLLETGKGAEMIVVGSRGHGALAGMLLGSVSTKVAAHAGCPVLIVHAEHAGGETAQAEKEKS